jgi:hypothetical protein
MRPLHCDNAFIFSLHVNIGAGSLAVRRILAVWGSAKSKQLTSAVFWFDGRHTEMALLSRFPNHRRCFLTEWAAWWGRCRIIRLLSGSRMKNQTASSPVFQLFESKARLLATGACLRTSNSNWSCRIDPCIRGVVTTRSTSNWTLRYVLT